jgi:hypothetical protein
LRSAKAWAGSEGDTACLPDQSVSNSKAVFESRANATSPPAVKADVWYEESKGCWLADAGGEAGHVQAKHFMNARHVPRGKRAHTVQGTVLQDGTGV